MPTVLVVDADARTRRLVEQVLRAAGFQVISVADADEMISIVRAQQPDVVVLDLNLPHVSDLDALRTLRLAGEDLPVVILSGVYAEDWVVAAFEVGADDYVTRPFSPRVLVARLHAAVRRAYGTASVIVAADERMADGLLLDPQTHQVRVGQDTIALSPTEYQLLRTLIRGAGRVFSTDELLSQVWGPSYLGQDDIVRANIYRLRHKLEPVPSEPRFIRGRRGVGYYFDGRVA